METEIKKAGGLMAIEYYRIELKNGKHNYTSALN